MPVKINLRRVNLQQQIDELRQKLKPDEGMDMVELSEKIGGSRSAAAAICRKNLWTINFLHAGKYKNFLVHPKVLAAHADTVSKT